MAAPRGGTRAARNISSVAAASAPSQQHQLRRSSISRRRQCPATMSGRRGFVVEMVSPDIRQTVSYSELFTRKSLGHSPEGEIKEMRTSFLGLKELCWVPRGTTTTVQGSDLTHIIRSQGGGLGLWATTIEI